MSQNSAGQDSPYLIVGLGNPGPKYAGTRHNAGFMALDELARRNGISFSQKQMNAEIGKGSIAGVRVIVAKPQTFMNNSGTAAGGLARFYKIPPERVLAIYDDIALPLGTIRIREKGSAAGHNGVSSLIAHLSTQNFPRVRIGVDKPVMAGYSQIDWVLGRFTKEEQPIFQESLSRAVEAVEAVMSGGIERAMNSYNTREGDSAPRARLPEPMKEPESTSPKERLQAPKVDGWAERIRQAIKDEMGKRE